MSQRWMIIVALAAGAFVVRLGGNALTAAVIAITVHSLPLTMAVGIPTVWLLWRLS